MNKRMIPASIPIFRHKFVFSMKPDLRIVIDKNRD